MLSSQAVSRSKHPKDPHAPEVQLSDIEELSQKDVWAVQQRWRELYAREMRATTGAWVFRGFDWHLFSYGFRQCVSGIHAQSNLDAHIPCAVVVFSDAGSRQTYGRRGTLTSLPHPQTGSDIIIAPFDFAWTYVQTHEFDLGPYFSQHDWRTLDPAELGED